MASQAQGVRRNSAAAVGLLVVLAGAAPVRADSLPLSAFSATVWAAPEWPTGPVLFEFRGPGLAFVGETAREAQPGTQLSPCHPRRCALGSSVDFANLTRTFGFAAEDHTITLGDETFELGWLSAQFTVRGAPMLLPATVDGTATVSTPVEVSASLTAWISHGLLNPLQAIHLNLNGSGTARMLLRRPPAAPGEVHPEDWLDEVTIQFGSPAPVPEPATMTLLGLGLGFVALRARRRVAKHESNPPVTSASN